MLLLDTCRRMTGQFNFHVRWIYFTESLLNFTENPFYSQSSSHLSYHILFGDKDVFTSGCIKKNVNVFLQNIGHIFYILSMLSNFEPSHDHQNIHHMKEFYIFVVKKSLTDQKMKTWVHLKKIQKKLKIL